MPNETTMKQKFIHKNQIFQSGEKVLYTYDVLQQDSEVQCDVYLPEDRLVLAEVHPYSITNSILVVLFLSLVVVSIVVRNLKQSLADYNAIVVLADKEQDDEEVDGPVGSLSMTPSSVHPPLLTMVFFWSLPPWSWTSPSLATM